MCEILILMLSFLLDAPVQILSMIELMIATPYYDEQRMHMTTLQSTEWEIYSLGDMAMNDLHWIPGTHTTT